jgi:type IV secretory pathway VirD2 relaxase
METIIRATAQGIRCRLGTAMRYLTATRENGASEPWSIVVAEANPVGE